MMVGYQAAQVRRFANGLWVTSGDGGNFASHSPRDDIGTRAMTRSLLVDGSAQAIY